MDKKSLISDVAGLSKPLTKLVETLANGAGILYGPIHKKRMAKATAEEIQIIADVCQKNLQIPIDYEKDGVVISTNQQIADLAKRAMLCNLAQEMNKQQNIEEILRVTKDVLEHETAVSNEPVSQTWLSNFLEAAGHVEEEDLQKIWGKLLAGEIKQPNSYSLRTLNTLKNMTTNEAKIFQFLSPYVMRIGNDFILPNDRKLHEKYSIGYGNILLLDECGLINAQNTLNITFSSGPGGLMSILACNLLAELHENAGINMHLQMSMYPLTAAGRELFQIVKEESNQDFFKDTIKMIEQNNKNISARIYKKELIHGKDGKMIEYFDIHHPIYPEK